MLRVGEYITYTGKSDSQFTKNKRYKVYQTFFEFGRYIFKTVGDDNIPTWQYNDFITDREIRKRKVKKILE